MNQNVEPLRFYLTPFRSYLQTTKNGPIFDTTTLQKSNPNLLSLIYDLSPTEIGFYKKICTRKFDTSHWIQKYQHLIDLYKSKGVSRIHSGIGVRTKTGSVVEIQNRGMNSKTQTLHFPVEVFYVFEILQLLDASHHLKTKKDIIVVVPSHFNPLKRKQILTAFEICDIDSTCIRLINLGLTLGPSVMSIKSSLVVKENLHQRLIVILDDNGLELHLMIYDKGNFSIKTQSVSGSFGFCLQEFVFDCTKKVVSTLPWGSYIPSFSQVYEELFQILSFNNPVIFPIKLTCCENFMIQNDLITEVWCSYFKTFEKHLQRLNIDNKLLNDVVVCGSGFLAGIIKSTLSVEFPSIRVEEIESNKIPQLIFAGLPCSTGNIKLIPTVYHQISYQCNPWPVVQISDLKVGEVKNVKVDYRGLAYVNFFRNSKQIFSSSAIAPVTFSVGVDINGFVIIKEHFSTNECQVISCYPEHKEQITNFVKDILSSRLNELLSSSFSADLFITLSDDSPQINANELEQGFPVDAVTLKYCDSSNTVRSIKLSKINYYSRTPQHVSLWESDTSQQPTITFNLELFRRFFYHYIVPNCIQLEKIILGPQSHNNNQIVPGDRHQHICVNTKNSKFFCRVDGHEFQIHPSSFN